MIYCGGNTHYSEEGGCIIGIANEKEVSVGILAFGPRVEQFFWDTCLLKSEVEQKCNHTSKLSVHTSLQIAAHEAAAAVNTIHRSQSEQPL